MRYHDLIEDLKYEEVIEGATSTRHGRGDRQCIITQRRLHQC